MADRNTLFGYITRAWFNGGYFGDPYPNKENYRAAFPTLIDRYGMQKGFTGASFFFQYQQINGDESGGKRANSEQEVINILSEGQPHIAEEVAAAEKAANKGVTSPPATQGATSPPQTQGISDPGLMNIINTLITQKAQVQGTGDTNIKEFEKQISDLKNQIAQAKEASETTKIEELNKRIEELNTQKAQAQASKETDIKEIERQIAELKKPEQSGISQIPMKIIAAVGGTILIVILLIAVILRGRK